MWRYLQDHFTSAEELQGIGNLPLIPVNLSQTPVTLTRLCQPSRVVAKRYNDVFLSDALTNVLTKLGLIVLIDFPTFISHHPAVWGSFVNPPTVQGVLKAMVVSASKMAPGTFSEIITREVSREGKYVLRSLLCEVRPESISLEQYNLLCSFSIFETTSKRFVSKNSGLCAGPVEPLPIPVLQDLVDIAHEDSRSLAVLLKVRILKPTELLCEMIFPDIQQGKYSEEDIDKLMSYVLKRFAHNIRTNTNFKRNIQALPFAPTETDRVRASDLFDPRNHTLQNLFAYESVFPVGELYNDPSVLAILEELGMKSERNITAEDLYQSAKQVGVLPPLPAVIQKSKAILQYISIHSQKLQEPVRGQQLGVLLWDIRWVSRLQQRTSNFPPSLPWWKTDTEDENHFFKPPELKSRQHANLIGTVKPVVDVELSNVISKYFGWRNRPDVFDVVRHLHNVITCYSKEEKPYYMVLVNEIYSFLSSANYDAVEKAFDGEKISNWVWNGDGFSSPYEVLWKKPPTDLTPYILSLPSEMTKYSALFVSFGMRSQSDPALLLQVLGMIKEKYDRRSSRLSSLEVKHDLKLSVGILNDVANEELPSDLRAKILLPTHVEDDEYVRLEPVEECMYCEHDDWLKKEGDDEEMEYFYVHPNVPNITAERLGVPSLTNRMLDPDELFIGEEFGQEEKLTTRLNRLLEDYTDGFAVPKELIQNADDAGATEVRFLYDERTNETAMTCLIDEGMKECQGPALWVYNDAKFKDEDFVNITRLNEATKAHDTEKIGRFGLGFNAVYNLTDVPMFISKNYFAIFDPHTSYLGRAIKNKRKPGMKIDLNKDVKRLRKFKNQFKPFNGIFGCDLHLDKEDNSFDGTLFRFPLRTTEQAIRSEIKQLYYNDQQMRELLHMFLHGAQHVLLFTQNVLRVGIYHLANLASQDPLPALLFEVTKSTPQEGIIRELSFSFSLPPTALKFSPQELSFLKQCNFLQASSKMKRLAQKKKVDQRKFPKSSMIIDVNSCLTKCGVDFFNKESLQEKATWLVVSSVGTGEAMQFAKNDPSLLPSAGVAVQLEPKESNTFLPLPVKKRVEGLHVNGTIFCYLPLPIHSGLPVHINGAFAVASNRRHLQEKVEDDKTSYGVSWNRVLLQDSVVSAFFSLLEDVKSVVPSDGSYAFHLLWPKATEVQRNCLPLMKSFYAMLACGKYSLFSDGKKWVSIEHVLFLDPQFRKEPLVGEAAKEVLQIFCSGREVVIDLPSDVLDSFEVCGLRNEIKARSYNKSKFLSEIFFPNILAIPTKLRDVLTLHVLDDASGKYYNLITSYACIPVSPTGNTLKLPRQLVYPGREAAMLFSPEDGRFPFGTQESYLNFQRLATLQHLGMASSDLPWSEVAERAESICTLNVVDSAAALKRVKALLRFMEKKINFNKPPTPDLHARILKAKFLPALKRPNDFPLAWKGDEIHINALLTPQEAFLEEHKYLVCCTEPLVGMVISRHVRGMLNLEKKPVTLQHVIQQLTNALSVGVEVLNSSEYKELNHVCTAAYAFLQEMLSVYGEDILEPLNRESFILVERRFLPAHQVAFTLSFDCRPYLFKLPPHLAEVFGPLMKAAGVKKAFDEQDYISSLFEVKRRFGENVLDEQNLKIATNLAVLLGETVKVSKVNEKWGNVYLPDSNGVMRPVPDLCVRDCPWMPDEPGVQFVYDRIPWPICTKLGVKTRREEALRPHVIGIPFGQREKLTNRLKRILTGYPCEKEILKELLQNADDAQATEICFIKDPRQHPDERVFEDIWKPLQGPALCVYNNKPFTNADIEGIRNLGEGSKGEDPNKTGQYGVGFNAVYHLTDVPSFMSKGEDIGDVLCAFDPHCRYVPDATPQEPGIMLKDITALKKGFPDVFPCYLEDHFPIDNGTMFRFPLRTRQMALVSQISSSPVTLKMLDTMMKDLKAELYEVLLFVNNVKKITICEVNEASGKLVNSYSVVATMSKEDESKRQAFANHVKQIGEKVKEGKGVLPYDIPVARVSYVLHITDSIGNEEKWLIVQQIGFEKSMKKSVIDAFKKHELGMLPRGGVACLLEKKNSWDPVERRKKAYCFLPLPFETDLPVHINGHFALDHEARRNLWRDEAGGYRSDWNNALLGDVVASCYLTLLVEVRKFLQFPITDDAAPCTLACSKDDILAKINAYEGFFPLEPPTDPYWKTLIDCLYQELTTKELKVLPVVRTKQVDVASQGVKSTSVVEVSWLPPIGSGRNQAFFNNLAVQGPFAMLSQKDKEKQTKARKRFEEILLESGFNLVAFSMASHESFQRSGVPTSIISPSAVIDFYKSVSSGDSSCKIGPIPCGVNETPFRDVLGVIYVLLYCKGVQNFVDLLPGLPLLLTQDNRLHVFSSKYPKFVSRFHDVLPGSPHVFLHDQVDRKVFMDTALKKSSVLRPLDAEGFAANLPQTLPCDRYGTAAFVEWSPDQRAPPNQRWISRVWMFLSELTTEAFHDPEISEESKQRHIKAAFGSLSNWSIIPATVNKAVQRKKTVLPFFSSSAPPPAAQFLVPLHQATSVLDSKSSDSSNLKLVEVLEKLGMPELNYVVLSSLSSVTPSYSSSNAVALARLMVSSLKVPASLLTSLHKTIEMDPRAPGRLDPSDCRVVLEYFSRSVNCLKDDDRSKLIKLPFYLATHGGLIQLDDARRVCVLPIGIPRKEMDVLERKLSVVFLESWTSLSSLFKFLALECITAVDVYCTYILPNLSIFSEDARMSHLEYIRKGILSDLSTEEPEKQRIRDCMKNTPLIPLADGTLKIASQFFDPCVDVFCTMLSQGNFPPKPFNSSEWLDVLRTIGLTREVSQDLFKRFARQVADEAVTERTAGTYRKSEVLVKHVITRQNVIAEGLLPSICDIPFVANEPARKALRALCQPFEEMRNGQSPFCAFKGAVPSEFAEVVWTKAHLLPTWANPRIYRRELGCPPGMSIDQYCNVVINQLKVQKKPTLDLVVRHCQTICLLLKSKSELERTSPEQRTTRTLVMERIYEFLQANPVTSSETKEILTNTPCILVEQGRNLILPSQAVLQLYERLEIKPFLYCVPSEFGKFHPLFEHLGCSKYVTINHYAMVLKMLHELCKDARLHPNEVAICVKAVKGFFEKLEENVEAAKNLSQLHLPGMSLRTGPSDGSLSVTLCESSRLIFNDAPPALLGRLQNFNYLFLIDLKLMEVRCHSAMTNYRDLVMRLPTALRPKMLSSMISEKLSDPQNIVTVMSETVNSLKHQMSSPQFCSGVIRLIRDENCQNQDFDEEMVLNIERALQNIEVVVVSNLKTTLFCDSNPIPESEAEVPHFLEKKTVSGEEAWTVYLNAADAMTKDSLVISLVYNVIVELYGGLLGRRAGIIFQMLNCPPNDIWSLLDSLGVRQDDSYSAAKVDIFPKLGTFIPLEDHHLLNDAFEEFEPGEYVGYELEDPSLRNEGGVATYIYAKIIKEVTGESRAFLAKRYRISIGGIQEIEVDATDLYKFHRLPTSPTAIVASENQQQSSTDSPRGRPKSRNKQEVFDEISDLLEEAWKLSEEKRRKIIKRLFLRWHPDKNMGDEEFCNEAFKHLQNEILRLERGEPRGSHQSSNENAIGTQQSSYHDFFTSWDARARNHHTQREGYRTRQQFPGRFTRRRNPQPGEARRWFRQAKADMAAAENDIAYSRPSYEWACFKCHQVW